MMRIAAGLLVLVVAASGQGFKPEIPKVWDEEAVERFQLPLA
jgi:hypothetical protein